MSHCRRREYQAFFCKILCRLVTPRHASAHANHHNISLDLLAAASRGAGASRRGQAAGTGCKPVEPVALVGAGVARRDRRMNPTIFSVGHGRSLRPRRRDRLRSNRHPSKWAPVRSAPDRSAPVNFVPLRLALVRFANRISARLRSALAKFAPTNRPPTDRPASIPSTGSSRSFASGLSC